MKKFFYSVLAVAFAALTFTSCDDVPMPYAQPEVNGGGQTYEGAEGDGTLENPYNVAGVLQFISTLESGVESTEDVYISGKVVSIAESNGIVQNYDTSGYGSATFDITDGTNTFTIYRAYYLNNQKWTTGAGDPVKIGDDVIICGKVYLYNGKTPETVSNKAYLYKLNDKTSTGGGGGSSGTATGDGTLQNPYNPTAANKLASSLGWKTTTEYETSDNVYVKGKISKINETYTASGNNGNATFFISEDGTEESDQFQCYRILYLGNKQYTSGTDIKVGDDVVIYGKLMNYRGNTPETVAKGAYLYSLNGNTEGGGDDTGGGDTGGGTEVSLTNPGFETWANDLPTGWKSASTASSATLVQSTDAHTGSYSCTIKGDEGNNKRLASQEMTLAAGDYTLTFWVKPTTEDAVQVRPGYVPVTDGTAGSYKYGDYVTLTSGWQQVTYTFSLTAETTICLVVMNPKKSNYSSGKDVLVDDFVLTKK
jgi:hypothetical protein